MLFALVGKSSAQNEYPQEQVTLDGDTVIVYTVRQAEKLTKAYQELEQTQELITGFKDKLEKAENIIKMDEIHIESLRESIKFLEDHVKKLDKQIKRIKRRARVFTSLASVGAVAVSVIILIL